MKRRVFAILIALMWLAIPLTALRYELIWNQLPARIATHFGPNGQANGWMPRETSLYFGLGLTAFVLIIFTIITVIILKQKATPDTPSFALLGFFYFMLGFVFYINNSILAHNLTGAAVTVAPLLLGVPLAIVLFVVIYVRAQRGDALPADHVLAEESHAAKGFSLLFLVLAIVEFAIAISLPPVGVRVAMGLLGFLLLLIAAHAWDDFHYHFSPAGLDISTLGLRLRSIPQAQIAKYRIEKWMALRGYGIRGVGTTRAYVWGNDVVHITTLEGESF